MLDLATIIVAQVWVDSCGGLPSKLGQMVTAPIENFGHPAHDRFFMYQTVLPGQGNGSGNQTDNVQPVTLIQFLKP